MKRWVIAIGLVTGVAYAEPRPHLELARERTPILDGHVTVRLAEGMVLDAVAGRAEVDWGTSRFTVETREIAAFAPGDVRARVAGDLGARAVAAIERLAVARPWQAYVVMPVSSPRVGDRELVLVAYLVGPDGFLEVLTFYIDETGFDDSRDWALLARRIAATMTPITTTVRPTTAPGGDPGCDVRDGEIDPRAVAGAMSRLVTGRIRGHDVYWNVWSDRAGHHAEMLTGSLRWGALHVICHATSAMKLAAMRNVVEAHFTEPPS